MVKWYDMVFFEAKASYALITSKKKFIKEYKNACKKFNIVYAELNYIEDGADATLHTMTLPYGDIIAFMCIDKKTLTGDMSFHSKIGLVVHESQHLLQNIKNSLGCTHMHSEIEAEAIQQISQCMVKDMMALFPKKSNR